MDLFLVWPDQEEEDSSFLSVPSQSLSDLGTQSQDGS